MATARNADTTEGSDRQTRDFGVDIGELSAKLRFNPDEGQIWLEGERMMLLHLPAFASLRQELIDRFGMDTARGMLMRMGHASGATDALIARRAKPHGDPQEAFMAGPRLHGIEGMVGVEPIRLEVNPETGFHVGEWIWRNSIEVDAHLSTFGISNEPVCWTLIGYASAFTSAFMGRPILYREVECRGMGASRCRIVGKPADHWDDHGHDEIHHGFDLASLRADSSWTSLLSERPFARQVSGDRLVGASSGFVSMMHLIEKVAPTAAPVLLVGEPGVGKKTAARALHKCSKRAAKPFVAFNCAALSGDMLDIELFGVEKSLAGVAKQGRLERASGGTLFLEDVHRLDLGVQAKLLRVMQSQEVERAGASQPRHVDVRLIMSSNASLEEALRAGQFREDLYYRMTMYPVVVPPLRERRTDLPLLIKHFAEACAARYDKEITGFSAAALGYLSTYDFPGNVAELESMIERAVIMAPATGALSASHLPSPIGDRSPRFFGLSNRGLLIPKQDEGGPRHDIGALDRLLESEFDLETFETELIARAVGRAEGNLTRAAKMIGLTRPQLSYRYKKFTEETSPS